MIQYVFKWVGAMLITLILFGVVMSPQTKEYLWGTVEAAMQNTWKRATFSDGVDYKAALDAEFGSVREVTSFP